MIFIMFLWSQCQIRGQMVGHVGIETQRSTPAVYTSIECNGNNGKDPGEETPTLAQTRKIAIPGFQVPGFSQIDNLNRAACFYQMVQKGVHFEWSPGAKRRGRLCGPPSVLKTPDFTGFVISTDASEFGVRAVLQQERDGLLPPIEYSSMSFRGAQSRWSNHQREALASASSLVSAASMGAFRPGNCWQPWTTAGACVRNFCCVAVRSAAALTLCPGALRPRPQLFCSRSRSARAGAGTACASGWKQPSPPS
jgi:hypothetical protein